MQSSFGRAKLLGGLALLVVALSTHAVFEEETTSSGGGGGSGGGTPPAKATLDRVEITGKREPGASTADIPSSDHGLLYNLPSSGSSGGQSRKAAPAADANEKPSCQNPPSKNPVILSSGEKYAEATDFRAGGLYGLGLTRRYHSKGTTASVFGSKWTSNYDYARLGFAGCDRLVDYPGVCFPHTIKHTDGEGAAYTYTRSGGGMYTVRGSVSAGTLSYDYDSGQAILLKGNQAYYYDLPSGKLSLIQAGANTLIFTYNGPYGLLSSVSNLVGQSIQFNWSNGYMTSIVDPGGNTWTYGYSGSGMLSSVVATGASADTRSYLYENADATLLTGISINGSRYSTYSYDGAKRGSQVVHTGGEVSETFSYGVNQTTVTDARGQSTTYSFTPVNAALQISAVSRAGTSTCPVTASSTSYDANGWVDYTYDWNGSKTDYMYDASGRMLQVTLGAGTAAALTTVHQWSGADLIETNHKDAAGNSYLRTLYTYFASGPAYGTPSSVTHIDPATGAQRVTAYSYTATLAGAITSRTTTQTLPGGNAITTYTWGCRAA